MRSFLPSVTAIALVAALLSCKGAGSAVSPDAEMPPVQNELQQNQPDVSSRLLWGYFRCAADLEAGTVTALPLRSAEVHINAVKPLNNTLGISISPQPGSTPPTGYFILNVTIKHPYPGTPQFVGFDVHGIFLSTASVNAGGLWIPGEGDPELLNADGWTRWWNPTEFTNPGLLGYVPGMVHKHPPGGPPNGTINPYKLFGDALWATADPDFYKTMGLTDQGARAIFRTTSANTRQYQIQFPVDSGPVIYFDYAVDASWASPKVVPPVNLPADFPINANAPEAFIVKPVVAKCTLATTPYGGPAVGQLELSVTVSDWQAWAKGSFDGEIGNVRLYSPSIQFDTPQVEGKAALKETVLSVTATGTPSGIGTFPVVIEIPAPGTSWKQSWQAAPAGEIAAYGIVEVEVVLMECTSDENVICDDAEPVGLTGSVSSSICLPHDPADYYVFVVPSGKVMEGTISLDNFDYSDNDLILYKGCPGEVVATALTPGVSDESLEAGNLEAGFYYVNVLPGEQAGTNVQPYHLSLDIHQPPDVCTTDTNNEYTSAASMGLKAVFNETVCSGYDIRDWVKITVPADKVAGGSIYVDNQSTGDINVRVYDVYPGPPTYWGINPGTQDEMVTIPGLGPGTHYIEVYAQGATPEGDRPFSLSTDLDTSSFSCTTGDGNDAPLTADPLGFTTQVSGTVCYPVDPDWFVLTVPSGKTVSGSITLSGSLLVDNDLYLYSDPAQPPIKSSAQPGVYDEVITVEKLDAGSYYVLVSAHPLMGGGDQQYTLTTSLTQQNVANYDFKIHAHIIRRTDGTQPATTEEKVQHDVDWAHQFYSKWGVSFTIVKISYINNTAWLNASSNEMWTCDAIYGDSSGPINVYYVNTFTDMENAAAYTVMDCRFAYQTHKFTYIVMSDVATNSCLAHEMGHAIAVLLDDYLLDYYTCNDLYDFYCPYPPVNGYCNIADKKWGNLMYWNVAGWDDPEDYFLSDKNWQNPANPIESQVENMTYFHTNYPNNF